MHRSYNRKPKKLWRFIFIEPSFCFYCQKKISSQLVMHLRDPHSIEIYVACIILMKDPTEQKRAAQVVKNLVNNQYNAEVLWKGEGELIDAKAHLRSLIGIQTTKPLMTSASAGFERMSSIVINVIVKQMGKA